MVLRVLNVAEKPSAAKEIVAVFRRGAHVNVTTRPSRSRYNIIYEFNMVVASQPAHMAFTSVLGHLKETDFEERVRRWGSCDPAILLDPTQSEVHWTVPEDKRALAQSLRSEARNSDWLILWLDCDSEGEKIANDVANVCREGKPSLIVKRARFSAMTNADIFRAINQLDVLNQRITSMVATRQEIDLRAGSAYTRFLTVQLEKFVLHQSNSSIISYGPCQFPTLGIIVDRWLQIKNFVSRDFWVFELFLKDCDIPFEWVRKQIFDEYTAMMLYELAYEEAEADGYIAFVENVQRRQRTKWRPLPLSTVEMQKVVSRLLHISSDYTMDLAESLYNKGLISYPRTETDRFASSYNLHDFIQKQTTNPEWGAFASRLLTPASEHDNVTFTWPRAGRNDDGAHPPIHPTNAAPETFDSPEHKRLYDYITKRFLASCSIDAKGAETVVIVRVGSFERFTAQGLIVEERGYLEVIHPFERWNDKEMPATLLHVHAQIPIISFLFRQSKTQPPPLLSEADLIALMDHHRIGTDATIAEHIKKVLDRGYVEKIGGSRFNPTDIGLSLVIAHERCQIHLARPHMRAKQEEELKRIVAQTMEPTQVLSSTLAEYRTLFHRLCNNRTLIDAVFQQRFSRLSAQSWETLIAIFSRCGACNTSMALKGSTRSLHTESRGARGRSRGRSRGRGRGTGGAAAGSDNMDRCLHCGTCDHTLKMPRNGILSAAGKYCPLCNYEVVNVSNASSGSAHTLCPQCMNNPPMNTEMNPSQKTSEFRCFMCTHSSCEFARGTAAGDTDVAKCPLCQRPCVLRSGRDASTKFISCSGGRGVCNFVYWFPRNTVATVSTQNEICAQCSSKKVQVTWMDRAVPSGVGPFAGCIWCDDAWRGVLCAVGEENSIPQSPHPGQPNHRHSSTSANRLTGWSTGGQGQSSDIENAAGRASNYERASGRGRGGSYRSGTTRARGRRIGAAGRGVSNR